METTNSNTQQNYEICLTLLIDPLKNFNLSEPEMTETRTLKFTVLKEREKDVIRLIKKLDMSGLNIYKSSIKKTEMTTPTNLTNL